VNCTVRGTAALLKLTLRHVWKKRKKEEEEEEEEEEVEEEKKKKPPFISLRRLVQGAGRLSGRTDGGSLITRNLPFLCGILRKS
jgi:CO dehydrogenase/acetyl-CoA synthase beta subunit